MTIFHVAIRQVDRNQHTRLNYLKEKIIIYWFLWIQFSSEYKQPWIDVDNHILSKIASHDNILYNTTQGLMTSALV